MEVPKLVLGDHELAARVTELLKPLVITPEKKTGPSLPLGGHMDKVSRKRNVREQIVMMRLFHLEHSIEI